MHEAVHPASESRHTCRKAAQLCGCQLTLEPGPLMYLIIFIVMDAKHNCSSSRALADILEDGVRSLGRWICMVLEWTLKRLAYSRIDLSLLERQSTSQAKHGRLLSPGSQLYFERLATPRLIIFMSQTLLSEKILSMGTGHTQ